MIRKKNVHETFLIVTCDLLFYLIENVLVSISNFCKVVLKWIPKNSIRAVNITFNLIQKIILKLSW